MGEIESNHEQALLRLDMEVKAEVANLDEEIFMLKDAVQTEKVKQERLKSMIARYSVHMPTSVR